MFITYDIICFFRLLYSIIYSMGIIYIYMYMLSLLINYIVVFYCFILLWFIILMIAYTDVSFHYYYTLL